jgi:histidinol-phosphate phosphatase family protein
MRVVGRWEAPIATGGSVSGGGRASQLRPWRWLPEASGVLEARGGRRSAVFLDRDGTLIRHVPYLKDPDQVALLPEVGAALRRIREFRGHALVLTSNQSSVGRGMQAEEELRAVHGRLVAVLEEEGVRLDAAYYCPHRPDAGCRCRKPGPGMIELACEEMGIDPRVSFMVGDAPCDVVAGKLAGCTTVQLADRTPVAFGPDLLAPDWTAIATFLVPMLQRGIGSAD